MVKESAPNCPSRIHFQGEAECPRKIGFWKELAADPQTTAADFELEIEQVPETISQFILGHEKSVLACLRQKR